MPEVDAVARLAVLLIITAAILAPLAVVGGARRAVEALCREVGSSPVALGLVAVLLATWHRIYLDGCRLGWWAALAEWSGVAR